MSKLRDRLTELYAEATELPGDSPLDQAIITEFIEGSESFDPGYGDESTINMLAHGMVDDVEHMAATIIEHLEELKGLAKEES
jgi:hypothetical protein